MRLHKMMRLQMWIPRISRCEGVGQGCMKILPGDNKRVVAVFPTVLVAVDAADPAAGQPLLPQPPLVVLQLLLRLTHLEKQLNGSEILSLSPRDQVELLALPLPLFVAAPLRVPRAVAQDFVVIIMIG